VNRHAALAGISDWCDEQNRTEPSEMRAAIRKLILDHLANEDAEGSVTAGLLAAYDAQCYADEEQAEDDEGGFKASPRLDHNAAWDALRTAYVEEYRRVEPRVTVDMAEEEFNWPEALPTDRTISAGLLKTIGRREARRDNRRRVGMAAYFAEEEARRAAGLPAPVTVEELERIVHEEPES